MLCRRAGGVAHHCKACTVHDLPAAVVEVHVSLLSCSGQLKAAQQARIGVEERVEPVLSVLRIAFWQG